MVRCGSRSRSAGGRPGIAATTFSGPAGNHSVTRRIAGVRSGFRAGSDRPLGGTDAERPSVLGLLFSPTFPSIRWSGRWAVSVVPPRSLLVVAERADSKGPPVRPGRPRHDRRTRPVDWQARSQFHYGGFGGQ